MKPENEEPLVQGGQGRTVAETDRDGRIMNVSFLGAIIVIIVALVMVFTLAGCSRPLTTEEKIRKIFQ